ncbi:AbrB/MazE/SpoVT family DNA-binding domain-containing protein [bacterium]|nr:AbrB/MazE/SpoVT family DNA-binding domain-containing protein [bacterium]
MIEKRVVQVGTSWGIVLPKSILQGLNIDFTKDKVGLYILNNEIRIKKLSKDGIQDKKNGA